MRNLSSSFSCVVAVALLFLLSFGVCFDKIGEKSKLNCEFCKTAPKKTMKECLKQCMELPWHSFWKEKCPNFCKLFLREDSQEDFKRDPFSFCNRLKLCY